MRNEVEEETALVNVERSPLFLIIMVILSAAVTYAAWCLLQVYNPWGFIVAIPGAILSFQSLWLLLNPFAKIFDDRFDIKQSFLHRKVRYFVDIKKVTKKDNGKFYITFNDDEIEKINLSGIKPSHVNLLTSEVEKKVLISISGR